jgi:hypothetical protein
MVWHSQMGEGFTGGPVSNLLNRQTKGIWFADCGARVENGVLEGSAGLVEGESIPDRFDEGFCYNYSSIVVEDDNERKFFDDQREFFAKNARGVSSGLNLPTLPLGWTFEGWVEASNGEKISTGQFVDPNNKDDSEAACGRFKGVDSCETVSMPLCAVAVGNNPIWCYFRNYIGSERDFIKTYADYPGDNFISHFYDNESVDITTSKVYVTLEPKAGNFDDPTGESRPFMKLLINNEPKIGTDNHMEMVLQTPSAVVTVFPPLGGD